MFRNREVRRFAVLFAAVAVTAAVIGFLIRPAAGILSLLSSAAFGAAFYAFTRARYQQIAEVSEQIDLVLHMPTGSSSADRTRASCRSCKARSRK